MNMVIIGRYQRTIALSSDTDTFISYLSVSLELALKNTQHQTHDSLLVHLVNQKHTVL